VYLYAFLQMNQIPNALLMDFAELGVFELIPSSSSSSSSNASHNSNGASDSSNSLDDTDNSMSEDSSSEADEGSEEEENAHMFAAYEELLFGAPRARVDNFLEIVHEKSDEEFRADFRIHRPVAYNLIGKQFCNYFFIYIFLCSFIFLVSIVI